MMWMRLGSGFSLLISLLSRRQNLATQEKQEVKVVSTIWGGGELVGGFNNNLIKDIITAMVGDFSHVSVHHSDSHAAPHLNIYTLHKIYKKWCSPPLLHRFRDIKVTFLTIDEEAQGLFSLK